MSDRVFGKSFAGIIAGKLLQDLEELGKWVEDKKRRPNVR